MRNRKILKILVLCVGKIPQSLEDIRCFSDVWNFYLPQELRRHLDLSTEQIPLNLADDQLITWFDQLSVEGYDAVLALGLRYFSTVPTMIGENLKKRLYPGFLCQIHDGSRLDNDPVDITFTLKNNSDRYPLNSGANRYVRHHAQNVYIGWAADPALNYPDQDPNDLRILVDHTNYGPNPVDSTVKVLTEIKEMIDSGLWQERFKSVSVRRFDSGRVVDVDFDNLDNIIRYDRTAIPISEISKEHSRAHIFCVTHPESVGLVVLETAMAGALILSPEGFLPRDRLDTVRAIEWEENINWADVLDQIDITASRQKALENSWENVAKRIRSELLIRAHIRGPGL